MSVQITEREATVESLCDHIDEIGQHLKDWDKVRELAGLEYPEEDSAQSKLVELLLVVAGHQESWGHEHVKEAARQWLESNVSGLGAFYADEAVK